jgi:hypothetical protein
MAAVDLAALPGTARKLLSPDAPAPLRMMAAKGVIPGLKPGDVLTVVALLSEAEDAAVSSTARATLANLPAPLLAGALAADLEPSVVRLLAEAYLRDHAVTEALLRMPRIDPETITWLAEKADERLGELVAVNEQRLLAHPIVIAKLYMNKNVRMSTSDRLLELAVRNGIELSIPAFKEAAAAIRNELVLEPTEEPSFDDVLFVQTEEIARIVTLAESEDTHDVDDEGEEQLKQKFLPLHAKVAQMTVTQKIRRAMLGSAAERMLLVRDSNRLVAAAAAKSPMMRDNEAVMITAVRSVSDDVLRIIANNREFTRNYQVKLNLVTNPRTPFAFASRFVTQLHDHDLVKLAKSKNISGAVAQAVNQQLLRKKPAARK